MIPPAAVVIATRERPVRLRWLLNALCEQDCPPEQFEVSVAYDPRSGETERVLLSHPLRAQGRLRAVPFPPHRTCPGAGRNAAWRATQSPLILFTDDDCRPHPGWVGQALSGRGSSSRVIQGRTVPDPDESLILRGAPWTETMLITPPSGWAEACNIAYPRELLEGLCGFDEQLRVGEDTELWLRARALGAELVAAPEMVVYHAVHARRLDQAVRSVMRWQDLAALVKRHPAARQNMCGRLWWKREHAAVCAAAAGLTRLGRDPRWLTLLVPWLLLALRHRGYGPRGLVRSATELPGRALIDSAEVLTLLRGSLRYRTLLL